MIVLNVHEIYLTLSTLILNNRSLIIINNIFHGSVLHYLTLKQLERI